MKLREVPIEIERLIVQYNDEETTDERRLEIENELNELDFTVEQKAAAYADLIAHYESEAEVIKAEEMRLAAWRKRCDGAAGWLRRNLQETLLAVNKRKFDTDFWKFSFRRSEAMVVTAEDVLPERFMIPVPATFKVDNPAIKKALQDECELPKEFYGEFESENIPGAKLEIRQNLQIK